MRDFDLSQMKSVGTYVTRPRSCPQLLHHRMIALRDVLRLDVHLQIVVQDVTRVSIHYGFTAATRTTRVSN